MTNGFQATVGGGYLNNVSGAYATIGGGFANYNSSQVGTIAGGQQNVATTGFQATVGGGYLNNVSGGYATIAGGFANTNSGSRDGVLYRGGAQYNFASGQAASIGGGLGNTNSGPHGFVIGWRRRTISASAQAASISGRPWATAPPVPSLSSRGRAEQAFCQWPGGRHWRLATIIRPTNTYATVPGGANNLAGVSVESCRRERDAESHP